MRSIILSFLLIASSQISFAQAPARLKYFGFAIVDCGLDDPNDPAALTNYISEVDTFSNVAQMCVENYTDTVINRVNLMNNLCVKPILSTSKIFIYLKDNKGPSGSNYDLYPDYLTRWNTFKATNAAVLNSGKINSFYVCDEPTWNGLTFGELDTICSLIKKDFPTIPLIFVEAYTEVAHVQVPTTVDWIGFDHYGIYNVATDPNYLAWLDTLESRRTTPQQKIFLVFDDEWNSGFWPGGWQPDTMDQVVQHYYDLAIADTNVIGLVGFTWPGLSPGWLGARSMPQKVKNKAISIGKKIKANYNPCNATGIQNNEEEKIVVEVYPNPAQDRLNIRLQGNQGAAFVKIYNAIGKIERAVFVSSYLTSIPIDDLSTGIYFYQVINKDTAILNSGKFVKE